MKIISNQFINNKIKSTRQSVTFNGYAACPLKNLYLQADSSTKSIELAKEIKQIGLKEFFNVFIQVGKEIYDPDNYPIKPNQRINSSISVWGQDNKIVVENKDGGKDEIVAVSTKPNLAYLDYNAPELLANTLQLNFRRQNSIVEYGNCFIGKNNKGEYYAIIGKDDQIRTSKKIALSEIPCEVNTYSDLSDVFKYKNLDFKNNKEKYEEKAKRQIAKDLNIKPKNIYFISQPDFHLDMGICPLKYPYVLVNDFNYSIEILNKLSKTTNNAAIKQQLDELIENTKNLKKETESNYTDADTICKELERYGFKVIKVPGRINNAGTNFMNSIVSQRPNGDLAYITNKSCWHEEKKTNPPRINLNEIFEKVLKAKVPDIKQVYFVSGPKYDSGYEYVSNSLENKKAGVHCMICEHPNFSRWNV